MSQAHKEAVRLHHGTLTTEHVLLGLLQLDECTAAALLRRLGVDPTTLQTAMLSVTPANPAPAAAAATGPLAFTPETKQVLERALEHASRLGETHVGTQHLLLGLTSVPGSSPTEILGKLGVTTESVLERIRTGLPGASRGKLRLLLISNSTMHGGGFLEHCAAEIRDFLGPKKQVLFVPYALADHDAYASKAAAAFSAMGHDLVSVHTAKHSPQALESCSAVFVGGGNTFRLLTALYHYGLLAAIQQKAQAGMPYIGSSAGTNVATLSIRTTNDMPIVQPPSFQAMQLVPFQINPHYLDPDPDSKHMGETREERLRQFHEEHTTPVLGMREGCMLRVEGARAELRGTTKARLFRRGQEPEEFTPPCDLSFLLRD